MTTNSLVGRTFIVFLAFIVLGVAPPATALASPADVVINEIRIDQPSTDNDEYFELAGAADTSLDNLTYLVIGDGTGGSGAIEAVVDLGSQSIPGSGFFVAAESTFTLGTADLTTTLNFENSDNVTHLLVEGFSGTNGDDLDTDDDGALDVTPWTVVVDLIALVKEPNPPSGTEFHYGPPTVGPDGSFVPGHVFRCDGSWEIGDFTPSGTNDTPGIANNCAVPPPPTPAMLVINEVDYDQPSIDQAEFVEIKNVGSDPVDLSSITLELVNGTGGGASIYNTIVPPAVSLAAGDYFVICGDAGAVANCDQDVTPDSNLIQNGAPDAAGLRHNGTLIDAVSYEGDSGAPYTEGSGAGLEDDPGSADMSISRCPDGNDTDQNNADFSFRTRTPGAENACEPPPPSEICGDAYTPIYDIQGSGLASPLVGMEVSTEGIVVGDFQNNGQSDNGDLNGFHIQDPIGDADVATSDGVFVFAPGAIDVEVGDRVRVRGEIAEFFSLTEISNLSLLLECSVGNSVTPASIVLPVTELNDFEAYEGMFITLPQELFISEFFNFDRFGEIVLTTDRQFQPTAIFEPGSPEAGALALQNSLSRITLDDGRSSSNPDPAIHPNGAEFTLDNRFRGGDVVQNITGVMDFAFGLYRIQPTMGAVYTVDNPRPSDNPGVGGNIQVAAFNVLNYFTTLDQGGNLCGPPGFEQECRGADDAGELERQRTKIVAALAELNADVVGLIEIQNDEDESVADLVAGLNDTLGAGTYDYISTGFIGTDAIRQALIYKPASVSPMGDFAVLDTNEFVDPNSTGEPRNRPALAQTFMDNETGGLVTVVVNHLKSKGSPCGAGDDDLEQGNCNLTRELAVDELLEWLATEPTGSDAGVLIIGDLNSYDKEDPIDVLLGAGYTDLLFEHRGELAYSFVFDGQLGYLDYALASPGLANSVAGAAAWHINADEPDILDYDTTFKQPAQDALFEPNEFRSSDHDPVVAGLDVCEVIAPTLEVSVSPNVLWPANHKHVDVTATVVVVDNFDPDPTVTLVSVTSNEPDDGLGDGDTANDIVVIDDVTFRLRAERSGTGDGRVYTITYQATDACGNSTMVSVEVTVPKSKGKGQ